MAAFAQTQAQHVFAGKSEGFFSALVARVVDWNEARLTRDALSALTDRELDDIGLSRGDIDGIAKRNTNA